MIVGIDPGGRYTGLVLRDGNDLVHWTLLTRDGDLDFYLTEVLQAVDELRDGAGRAEYRHPVAIEDVVAPNPHMGISSVIGILETAQVLGAIAGQHIVTRIPPGGHGSGPRPAYPAQLWGKTEVSGTGKFRHLRSAWDVAGAGLRIQRHQALIDKGGNP